MRDTAVLLTFTAVLAASATARAAPPDYSEILVRRVSPAGLDLHSEAGAAQFLARLSRAAATVCGGEPDRPTLASRANARFKACRAQALSGAVAQVRSDVLRRQFAAMRAGHPVRVATN